MIETEIDNMLKEIDGRLAYQGMNLEQYLKMLNKTEDDMRKEYEAQAAIVIVPNEFMALWIIMFETP